MLFSHKFGNAHRSFERLTEWFIVLQLSIPCGRDKYLAMSHSNVCSVLIVCRVIIRKKIYSYARTCNVCDSIDVKLVTCGLSFLGADGLVRGKKDTRVLAYI